MTLAAILLLILSAVLHASWNFICKRGNPSAAFLLVANSMGCLILVPVAVIYRTQYALFSSQVCVLVLAAGIFQSLYYSSLAGAYRAGDMSLAYPLARSSPLIVVTAVTFILGQGDAVSPYCILGIFLVFVGCFMVPMTTFRDFRFSNYLCRTCAMALLAAVGTAGYSIVDAEALGRIRSNMGAGDSVVIITMLYALAEALSSSIFLLLYVSARLPERTQFIQVLKKEWRMALLAGIGIYLTYTLVLISMSMVRNVSYVVGFRQLSIPLGVVMSIIFLKEPMWRPKICGVSIIVIGLVLIAMG
jgi:drug/metabolite transporter (DMT)-like permease